MPPVGVQVGICLCICAALFCVAMACLKEIMECAGTMSVPCFKEMAEGVDPSVVNALAVVGGLVLVRSALCLLGAVFTTFLRPGKNLKKYGTWAVVTGATGENIIP